MKNHVLNMLLAGWFWMVSCPQAAAEGDRILGSPSNETLAVVHTMKRQFDQPKSPLKVAPVVVEGDWALASWLQDVRGGRAVLQKRHGHWVIMVCGGDGLRQASTLVQTGMPADVAAALAKNLQLAEARLPEASLKKISSFEGLLRVDSEPAHGHGHRPKVSDRP